MHITDHYAVNPSPGSKLVDKFGRHVTYVRLSVTDRCNLRCVYCMSENMSFVPRNQLLTLEEMSRIGQAFVDLGVNKIRITGGEPLARCNILQLFKELGALEQLDQLTLTTNGTELPRFAQQLHDAGVTRINISLDSIRADRFRNITRNGDIQKTLAGIDAALEAGFDKIKLNAVILKNRNHDEVLDLVRFARERNLDISFIEEMPMGIIEDHGRAEAFYSSHQILSDLSEEFELLPSTEQTGGPSRYYHFSDNHSSRIGFISPHSHNFCDSCNRVRVTAEGRLLLCLGQEHSVDLRHIIRANPGDDDALKQAIIEAMQIKPKGHEFDLNEQPIILRHMNATGG